MRLTLPHKQSRKIKKPHPKLVILLPLLREKEYSTHEAKGYDSQSMISLTLQISGAAFIYGHPV